MIKKTQRTSTAEVKGQGGKHTIWSVVAAAFGALVVVSFLAPVDSISVFVGTALPQNLGWLLIAVLAAFAARGSFIQVQLSRTEVAIVGLGLSWLVAVTWFDSQQGNGRAVWNGFWHVMSLASCFYIGRALFGCAQVREASIFILLVGCTAMSLVGLEQVLISLPANRAAYAENPDRMLAENGIDAPLGSPRRAQFENRLNSPEPFANFALANSLASLLCVGVILSGGALANVIRDSLTDNGKNRKWFGLIGWTIALLTQLICLLLTRSRTAYLSVLAAVVLWLILEWLRGKARLTGRTLRLAGSAVGLLALIGFGWLLTVDSLVWSEAPKSISYRLEYWQATLAMIRDHFWTGVGLGNFQAYYPQYKLEQASEIIADPHNWVLDVAATLSVPIAVISIGWVGVTLAKGVGACLGDGIATSQETECELEGDQQLVRGYLFGAACGGVLAAIVLGISGNLDMPTNLMAWGISAALIGMASWGTRIEMSAANLVAAVAALVLCLLSSGSWQASGIAIPLMVLMANHWRSSPLQSHELRKHVESSWGVAWVAPLVATAAFSTFVLQTWRPVMQSWMLAESSASAQSEEERIRLFEQAANADPLDKERAMHRIQLLAVKANEATDVGTFTSESSSVLQELQRLSPPDVVGFLIPKLAGEISSQLAVSAARRGLPNQAYLDAAGGFYSLAVERYPSSVEMLVQHAAALALVGDWKSAEMSIEKAGQISDRTPHLDKKMAAQVIRLPLKPAGFEWQSDYVPAEPLVDWLRTEIRAKLRR